MRQSLRSAGNEERNEHRFRPPLVPPGRSPRRRIDGRFFLVCAMHKVPERINIRTELSMFNANTSSTRTRQGGSCLKDINIYIRTFSSIELACAVRQPSPCVRALCETGVLFHMSHSKLHFAVCTSHSTLHTSHCTLRTPHFTLHTPHFTLHSSHSTLRTSHFTLHSSHSTLHTPHFTLHSSHSKLHTSHSTLHTPHFISSELFSPYPSSSLLISSLLICHLSCHESLPSTTSRTCMRRAPARPMRACFVRSCCSVAVQELDLRATPVQCNVRQTLSSHFTLHSSHPTLHTSHLHFISTHLI